MSEKAVEVSVEGILRSKCKLKQWSVMLNVEYKMIDLIVNKEITPSEQLALRLIWLTTAGAHNRANQHREVHNVVIDDLARAMKIRLDHFYEILKSLENKKLIIRSGANLVCEKRKPGAKGPPRIVERLEYIGLNKEVFGEVLTDRQKAQQPSNVFKLHPGILPKSSLNKTKPPGNTPQDSGVTPQNLGNNTHDLGDKPSSMGNKSIQDPENKGESNPPLLNSPAISPALSPASEKTVNKNNWEEVRAHLLRLFPNDEVRLDRTYKQIMDRGYEQQGKAPFKPNNLPAWIYHSYQGIRHEYAFHDVQRRA